MKPILAPQNAPLLRELARAQALLAFDFDGTLAPIVADRHAAALRPETHRLLRAVALLYPCVVISGRARRDVASRLRGIPLVAVVGNHGAEAGHGPLDRSQLARVAGWVRSLSATLGGAPGIDLEDKRFSIAVHYRGARNRIAARRRVLRAVAGFEGARVFGGRAVVNLVPDDAPDKASALADLVRRSGARAALYVGDDRTDEAVFRSAITPITVRVGRTGRSRAGYYLPGQGAIDELLRALLGARARLDGLGNRADALARTLGA